jgi:hypothetical protein
MRQKVDELWSDFLDGLAETNEQIAEQQPATNEKLNPVVLQRDILRCCKLIGDIIKITQSFSV